MHGFTAIPEEVYLVTLEDSPHFGEDTITLSSLGYTGGKIREDIDFDYILSHGGNDHKDTLGCPLVAFNLAGKDENGDYKIYGRADIKLKEWIKKEFKKGNCVIWKIKNLTK